MSRSEEHFLVVPPLHEPNTLTFLITVGTVLGTHAVLFSLFDEAVFVVHLLALELGIAVLLACLLRSAVAPRWILSETKLCFEGRFTRRSISCAGIERLGYVRIVSWYHVLTIESTDGRLSLHWVGRELPPTVQEFRDALARRTSQRWRGGVSGSLRESAQWILEEIEAVTDRRKFARTRWIVRHMDRLRIAEIGVQNPLLSGANILFVCGHVLLYIGLGVAYGLLVTKVHWLFITGVVAFLWLGKWMVVLAANLALLSFDREVRAREGIEGELEAAREVQQRLLPAGDPELPGLDVHGECEPAREVGGDYFDFFHFEGRTVVAIADIAGKGLAAGLLMTLVKGTLGAVLSRGGDLREAALAVGEQIRRSRRERRFVTLALAEIDHAAGKLRLLRAGHNPPLLLAGSSASPTSDPVASRWLEPPGVALGLGRDGRFEESCEVQEILFSEGDVLVLYTDGVTEALNASAEEFGDERLRAAVAGAVRESAEARVVHGALIDSLNTFRGDAPASDDVTVVVLRRSLPEAYS